MKKQSEYDWLLSVIFGDNQDKKDKFELWLKTELKKPRQLELDFEFED